MEYRKIIFVCTDNTAMSPMAAAIMNDIMKNSIEIYSRGVVVLFSEPYNPKIYEILKKRNIPFVEGNSKRLMEKDFSDSALVLVADEKQKLDVYGTYNKAINVYTIKEFIGQTGDITEPYGQGIDAYEEVFDELYDLLTKIKDKMFKEDFER